MFDDTGGYPFRRWIQSYVSYMFITYGWGEEHPQFSALFVWTEEHSMEHRAKAPVDPLSVNDPWGIVARWVSPTGHRLKRMEHGWTRMKTLYFVEFRYVCGWTSSSGSHMIRTSCHWHVDATRQSHDQRATGNLRNLEKKWEAIRETWAKAGCWSHGNSNPRPNPPKNMKKQVLTCLDLWNMCWDPGWHALWHGHL
jgi:hypothetical protein